MVFTSYTSREIVHLVVYSSIELSWFLLLGRGESERVRILVHQLDTLSLYNAISHLSSRKSSDIPRQYGSKFIYSKALGFFFLVFFFRFKNYPFWTLHEASLN